MTSVTLVGPPESNGGVGQYTSKFADAFEESVPIQRFKVGFNPLSHLRLAIDAADDGTEAVHIQFVYSFVGPAGVLSLLFFPALYVLTRLSSNRVIVTLHEVWNEADTDSPVKEVYAYVVHTVLSVCTDDITFLSENAQDAFHRTAWAGETSVVPHGVNKQATRDVSDAREYFGLNDGDIVVSQHGYVNPRKGVETFFEIAEKLPEYEFLLAGGARSTEHETYFKEVRSSVPSNVTITGVLDEEKFHAAFNATDVVILPYRDINQSGIFNWCAAYGIPTIGTEIAYFRELQQEWGCPITFQRGDVEQAANTVNRLVESAAERNELVISMEEYAARNSMRKVVKWFREECYTRP